MLAAPLSATSIGAGQFNLSGNLYITNTQILFGLNSVPPPGDQTGAIQLPDTGPFSTLTTGQTAAIHNLTSPPNSTTGALNVSQWIVLPDNITLDLTTVPINTTIAACTGTSADNAIGHSCRATAVSPVILTQTATGVTAELDTMGNAYVTGTSATGTSPFTGVFSANFTTPNENTISSLLGTFGSQGFVNTSYSAN